MLEVSISNAIIPMRYQSQPDSLHDGAEIDHGWTSGTVVALIATQESTMSDAVNVARFRPFAGAF